MSPTGRGADGGARPELSHRKLTAAFSRRFWLRHHLALMLAAVIGAGMLANHLLKRAEVWSLPGRYALVVTIAYLAYFPVGMLWLAYIRRELAADSAWPHQVATARPDDKKPVTSAKPSGATTSGSGVFETIEIIGNVAELGLSSEIGCAILLLLPVLVAVLGCGGYLLLEAPLILTDAAFETILAFALVRPVRKMSDPERSTGLWGATWHIYGITLAAALLGGAIVESLAPGARTLGEALRQLF